MLCLKSCDNVGRGAKWERKKTLQNQQKLIIVLKVLTEVTKLGKSIYLFCPVLSIRLKKIYTVCNKDFKMVLPTQKYFIYVNSCVISINTDQAKV